VGAHQPAPAHGVQAEATRHPRPTGHHGTGARQPNFDPQQLARVLIDLAKHELEQARAAEKSKKQEKSANKNKDEEKSERPLAS
jgi:hypothetical protein